MLREAIDRLDDQISSIGFGGDFSPVCHQLAQLVTQVWPERDNVPRDQLQDLSGLCLEMLDRGAVKISEPDPSGHKHDNGIPSYVINDWPKLGILMWFKSHDMEVMRTKSTSGPGMQAIDQIAYDKVPLKTSRWGKQDFEAHGFRVVPGGVIRYGAYIAPNVILMPSFINLGAYVDSGTMIDTWATVGSCAQVGKNCHISGGAGLGGVLEPINARPVIVEDDRFIGARSEVAEGVVVGRGSVLSMGVYIGASTPILNRKTGEITTGYVPPYSVVIPGALHKGQCGPSETMRGLYIDYSTYAAVIVKTVDEKTRACTSINDLLRD